MNDMKQTEFFSFNKAKAYCYSLGKISDIKFIENHAGYANLKTTQFLLKIDGKHIFCGGSFSSSKAKTIWFVTELTDINHLKLRDHTGYPYYNNAKSEFLK